MSRFANRKLISHHITSSRLDSMLRQHAARDCHSIPTTPRPESNTWCSISAMDVSQTNPSWNGAPRLLRYLGGNSKSCSVCGLNVESEEELISACSECPLKIEAALTRPGRDQAGMDQSRKGASSSKKRTKVAKETEQPCNIIIMQHDKNNALVKQLTNLLNRACPASQEQSGQQKRQQQRQQQRQQPEQQKRQQRSLPLHSKNNLVNQRYTGQPNSPKNMPTPDTAGFSCYPQLGLDQQNCKYASVR